MSSAQFHLDRVSAYISWFCQASSSLNSHRLVFFGFRQERFYDYSASYLTILSNGPDRPYNWRYRYLSETSSLPNVLTLSHVRYQFVFFVCLRQLLEQLE